MFKYFKLVSYSEKVVINNDLNQVILSKDVSSLQGEIIKSSVSNLQS